MVKNGAASHKTNYIGIFSEILNLEGHHNRCTLVDFAYWWSCIRKGLRLQPAQQACFLTGTKSYHNKVTPVRALHAEKIAEVVFLSVAQRCSFLILLIRKPGSLQLGTLVPKV